MGLGLTLTEALLPQVVGEKAQPLPASWEVGRLVLGQEHRADVDALRRCLFLALDYLSRNAHAENLYASCSHVLSRLYRRFGFAALAKEVLLSGTDKSYTLIHGYAVHVLGALAGSTEGTQSTQQ